MTPETYMRDLESALATQQRRCGVYDRYYEGEQPLKYVTPVLQEEMGDRLTQLVINWPRLGVDAYENRLDVEGFRFPDSSSGDDDLWAVWQANGCDEQSQLAHLDSLALGCSFVIVGSGNSPDDPPVITVESPFQVATLRDPKTRRVSAAWKRWTDADRVDWGTLYLPDSTRTVRWDREWLVDRAVDNHGLGRVPVVPLPNRPRLMRPDGLSEFHDVIPIADAANKMATDMMVSGEYHAMPRRWAFGLKREDFQDENGNDLSSWSAIAGRLWASENPDVKVGQFPEADLAVFHNTIKMLAQIVSQQLALPPHYMAFVSDNPTSADAIRSSEAQLVKKVERKHTFLGGAWEEAMRLVLRIQTGEFQPEADRLETVWRDPSTPTIAQKADAVVKLATAQTADGRPILPLEQARIDLGYTDVQRQQMADMDRAANVNPAVQSILDRANAVGNG